MYFQGWIFYFIVGPLDLRVTSAPFIVTLYFLTFFISSSMVILFLFTTYNSCLVLLFSITEFLVKKSIPKMQVSVSFGMT